MITYKISSKFLSFHRKKPEGIMRVLGWMFISGLNKCQDKTFPFKLIYLEMINKVQIGWIDTRSWLPNSREGLLRIGSVVGWLGSLTVDRTLVVTSLFLPLRRWPGQLFISTCDVLWNEFERRESLTLEISKCLVLLALFRIGGR